MQLRYDVADNEDTLGPTTISKYAPAVPGVPSALPVSPERSAPSASGCPVLLESD